MILLTILWQCLNKSLAPSLRPNFFQKEGGGSCVSVTPVRVYTMQVAGITHVRDCRDLDQEVGEY